jgi:hypothetical protein
MRTKNGGPKRDSKNEVEIKGVGDAITCAGTDTVDGDGEHHVFAPLQARVLDADEQISFDFQETKTISEIVEELRGSHMNLNDLRLDTVLKACEMFSAHSHSVIPDQPVNIDNVALFQVAVDIDSALSVFKRRSLDAAKQDIDVILKRLTDTLGTSWTGFLPCTNYCANNDWIKAFPSNKTGGPTIEPFQDGGRFRIELPTPPGTEVLKVYVYSPKKVNYSDFIKCVRDIIHKCACFLLKQANQERLLQAVQSTHDKKLHGGKSYAIPGGYKMALGTALQFLEKHPEGALVLETFNCKQKNLRFQMPAKGFGTDSWLNSCVHKIDQTTKECETMIKVMCRLDRLAEIDPSMSSVGFGFELR